MPTDEVKETGVRFAIWIGEEAEEGSDGFLREVVEDVPVGKPFETAMRLMRDEGWDIVTVIRTRK